MGSHNHLIVTSILAIAIGLGLAVVGAALLFTFDSFMAMAVWLWRCVQARTIRPTPVDLPRRHFRSVPRPRLGSVPQGDAWEAPALAEQPTYPR
jgi:hypothetical protein